MKCTMIKDLITYFKFSKYVPLFKLYVGISIMFMIYGLMFLIFGADNHFVSTLQLTMGLNYTTLIVSSTIFNDMIGSSPMKRFFEITAPNIFATFSGIIIYAILIIASTMYLRDNEVLWNDITESFISGALGFAFTLIFLACMYKHLIIGCIMLGIEIIVFMFFSSLYEKGILYADTLSELYIKGAVIMTIGIVLSNFLRHIFEKHSYMSIYEKQATRA